MTVLFTVVCGVVLLFAQPGPLTLDQVRAETNPERRARSAVEYAAAAERKDVDAILQNDSFGVPVELVKN